MAARVCSILGMASKSILRDFFSSLPDPRIQRTRKHKLTDVIVIVLIGTIGGCRSWDAMHAFIRWGPPELRALLELPHGVPCADTLRRVMSALDPAAFRNAFIAWANALCKSTEGKLVAIDGKTVRGAFREQDGFGSLHLINAWVKENAMTLGQYATDIKSNEITAIPELLKLLSLKGAIVTTDAMGCQKDIARCIRERGAHYLFGLKANQPSLHQEVLGCFDEATCRALASSKGGMYMCADKGHGRHEVRRTWVLRDVDWLRQSDQWPDLKTLVLVESERTRKGVTTRERRTYISSLDAPAERMGELARGHWHVENRLHWVLDVTFGEDRVRVAKKNGAENLALVRKIALNMLRRAPNPTTITSLVGRQQLANWRTDYLLTVLRSGFLED
jgi:predicted transposase YbfD/YdcC